MVVVLEELKVIVMCSFKKYPYTPPAPWVSFFLPSKYVSHQQLKLPDKKCLKWLAEKVLSYGMVALMAELHLIAYYFHEDFLCRLISIKCML